MSSGRFEGCLAGPQPGGVLQASDTIWNPQGIVALLGGHLGGFRGLVFSEFNKIEPDEPDKVQQHLGRVLDALGVVHWRQGVA